MTTMHGTAKRPIRQRMADAIASWAIRHRWLATEEGSAYLAFWDRHLDAHEAAAKNGVQIRCGVPGCPAARERAQLGGHIARKYRAQIVDNSIDSRAPRA